MTGAASLLMPLALLALALAGLLWSGWPSWVVLLATSLAGALAGMLGGQFGLETLAVLPQRLVGLLEHDLLQALALYALVGALLDRLSLAPTLRRGFAALWRRLLPRGGRAAEALSRFALASLLAPMNGSVGASLLMLARSDGETRAADPARHAAETAVASTLGVIVPPSLVLLLLGDAMMRAHTEGQHLAQLAGGAGAAALASQRIVNTQDVMQAGLLPALLVWLAWGLWLAFWPRPPVAPATLATTVTPPVATPLGAALTRREAITCAVVVAAVALLLVGVALGRLRAVEAAASAGVALMGWAALTRQFGAAQRAQVFDDAMATTGALFALLIAATTFSMVLRGWGLDAAIATAMQPLAGHPLAATALVEGVLLASAFVLDAFELIFLLVPLLMPPLLAQVSDAAWVAALTLLVLQLGFLLPPFGVAFLLARVRTRGAPQRRAMARAIVPALVLQAAVIVAVLAWPGLTRWARASDPGTAASVPAGASAPAPSEAEVEALMRGMSAPPK